MLLNDDRNKRRLAQGGGVAAPVGGKVLGEVLPYLCPDNKITTNEKSE